MKGSPEVPISFFTIPFLSRRVTILFRASVKATNVLFAETEAIIALSSNGPHSEIILPLPEITRIVSMVEAKTVSFETVTAVTGFSVFKVQRTLSFEL